MRVLNRVVLVAAVGNFVDVLDLTLFQNVRVPSLVELGVPNTALFEIGVMILDAQLAGMFLGGLVWGSIADRRGRKAVLFASILVYSIATLASAFVHSVPTYALARFICGFGLAGELGAGVALIAEILPPQTRGYGTTLCAGLGFAGALVGAGLALSVSWRAAYLIGGIGGLLLLVMRARAFESSTFEKSARRADLRRGLAALFTRRDLLTKYALSLAISLPIFYVILTLVPFAPELTSLRLSAPAATSIVSAGLLLGDVVTGLASQRLHSRKRPIHYSIYLIAASVPLFLFGFVGSKPLLIVVLFLCGVGAGYMVLFLTNAAEQFGTNVRGVATVLAPNVMRASVVVMTFSVHAMESPLGLRTAALVVGAVCVAFALLALRLLPETFGRNLDFDEP
jgi:MFS transporter, putative metabolite:H+ symporter